MSSWVGLVEAEVKVHVTYGKANPGQRGHNGVPQGGDNSSRGTWWLFNMTHSPLYCPRLDWQRP